MADRSCLNSSYSGISSVLPSGVTTCPRQMACSSDQHRDPFLASLHTRWTVPKEPPIEVQLLMRGERTIGLQKLGSVYHRRSPFVAFFDHALAAPHCLPQNGALRAVLETDSAVAADNRGVAGSRPTCIASARCESQRIGIAAAKPGSRPALALTSALSAQVAPGKSAPRLNASLAPADRADRSSPG